MTSFVETKMSIQKGYKNNIELVDIDKNLKDIKSISNSFIINIL